MSRFVLTAQLQLQAPNNVAQVVRQIQSQLNNVNVNVQVQGAAQAQRQLQQVTAQTQAATTAADRMGRAFAVSIRRFAAFSIATRAVGLFTSTLSDAIKSAIDFEREMVRVSQVTGQSIGNLKFLTKAITDLSTGLGVSSKDLLNTGQLLLQAGISAKDTEVALKTLAKAALAPNFDSLSETTEGAIAILAQFQEGVGALEKQLGAINAVAGAFAVEAGDLIDVIRRAGGVFKSSGGDLNELIALFTSVRATTRESAESIGTGLRTIFTRIQRPKTIEFLKQFGVELVDLEGKFVGPFEAVKRLSTALSGLGEGDITFIRIAEELGGFRQIGKVLPLLQQFSTAQAALNVANKAGNSLTQDAATAQQALAIRILKVKEEFLALVRSMTETSTFQIMANTALSLASALIQIGEAIKPLLPLLAAVAAVNFAKGISGFAGGLMRGMQSGRTYSTGGKVHHFARGGMVPGTGNRDTVPAMLQPGEFVIRKNSVNKLGASNLAAMNENGYAAGGKIQRFAYGGKARKFGIAALEGSKLDYPSENIPIESIISKLGFNVDKKNLSNLKTTVRGVLGLKGQTGVPVSVQSDLLTFDDPGIKESIYNNLKNQVYGLVTTTANTIGKATGIEANRKQPINPNKILNKIGTDSTMGSVFEGALAILGGPFSTSKSTAAIDFPRGLGRFSTAFSNLNNMPVDAKRTADTKKISEMVSTKIPNYFADFVKRSPIYNSFRSSFSQNQLNKLQGKEFDIEEYRRISGNSKAKLQDMSEIATFSRKVGNRQLFTLKNTGGIIQKFAVGGEAQKVANMMGKGKALADSWWTGMFAGNNVLFDWAAPTKAFKIPTGEEVPVDQNLRKILREKAQREWMAFKDKMTKERDAKKKPLTPEEKTSLAKYSVSPEQVEQIKKEAEAKRAKAYVDKTSGINWDVENSGLRRRRPEDYIRRSRGFATGGGVGTDTVPALLTPGEFVVNRSSAQSIGYGNLNRMNKVGKYAKGGVVQHFAAGGVTATPASSASRPSVVAYVSVQSLTQNAQALKANTQAVQKNATAQNQQRQSVMDVVNNNKMFAASMATSLIAGFLPAVDENSGALLKLSHSFLGMITTIASVGFALEAFGINLKKQAIMDFLGGQGFSMRSLAQGRSGLMSMGLSKTFSTEIIVATQSVAKFVGPVLAATAASYAVIKSFNALVSSVYDVSAKLKKSIESGDVGEASRLAGQQYDLEAGNTARAAIGSVAAVAGGVIGAIAGSFAANPLLGAAIGATIGASIGSALGAAAATLTANFEAMSVAFGGNTRDSLVKLSAVQAGAVKTQKSLDQAQQKATITMEQFQNGAISAAEALNQINSSSSVAVTQQNRALDFAVSNTENRAFQGQQRTWGGYFRDVGATASLGYMDSSEERNTRLGEESAKQIRGTLEASARAFAMATGARTATMRMGIATKQDKQDIRNRALGVGTDNDLLARQENLAIQARVLAEKGDTDGSEAADEAFRQVTEQIKQTDRELANLEKEMKIASEALKAMNLGLRGPEATATAMSASMNRFAAGLEVGGSTFTANAEFLSEAMTTAAQAMDPDEIKSAISSVSDSLRSMGADPTKFEQNTQAFVQAQQNYNAAFKKVVGNLNDAYNSGRNLKNAPDDLKKAFAEELTAGLGPEAKNNLTAIIKGIELSPTEVEAILGGNLQVFGDKLSEAGKKQLETIVKIAQERQNAEQVVIGLIQKRADAERNLANAQKEAVDLYMEGRDVQAKYGGVAVTSGEKRAAIVAKANAGAGNAGLQAMRTGSVAEIRARNAQIAGGIFGIETRRRTDGGMQRREGAEANITQQNLQQAQKDQIDTIRSLIKLEEEELKIIQEKNRMEKDSLESLISGDIDKFFEQQAAVGAQAAIATGDMTLANQFGSKAVGDAFKDIQRQQEAGVQSLYGRQLAGPGGLTEQAAGAALASRGVMDPRMAQTLAGTTPEEAASQRRLQELGGVLRETGAWQQATAEMQVQTASINVTNAKVELAQIEERGRQAADPNFDPVAGFARGGVVYANRGMFVPRGTDTVPAMLTPGEFVVRRESVNRGNNLQLLEAINNNTGSQGFARGGKVGYYNNGGRVQYKAGGGLLGNIGGALGIDPQLVTNLGNIFNTFVSGFNESIKNLQNTKLQVKLDSVNVNVNLNGTSMLTQISDQTRQEIMKQVVQKIQNEYSVGPGGKLTENRSNLPR